MSEQPIRVEWVVRRENSSPFMAVDEEGAWARAQSTLGKSRRWLEANGYRALPGPFVLVREAEWAAMRDFVESLANVPGADGPCPEWYDGDNHGDTADNADAIAAWHFAQRARAALQPREAPKR